MGRIWVWLSALALAVVAAFAINYGIRALAPPPAAVQSGEALIGGPFALIDQYGNRRTDADFRGQYMLIFFGYTNCPDVCPVALQNMTLALDELGADGEAITPIFITVDPHRDTVALLRDYTANFHPRLIALTGASDRVADALRAYRVYRADAHPGAAEPPHADAHPGAAEPPHADAGAADPSDDEDYLVDHTSILYLMGPDGAYVTHFSHVTPPADMAAILRAELAARR